MDAQTLAWLDQEDARTAEIVRRHGWMVQYVFGEADDPPFAYTIGLFGLAHPELLIFGCSQQTALSVLNEVGRRVKRGANLVHGEIVMFPDWAHRLFVEAVPNPGQIVFAANRFYCRPPEASVPVYQLTYDDRAGRFPWEPGYAFPAWVQPRPGTFTA